MAAVAARRGFTGNGPVAGRVHEFSDARPIAPSGMVSSHETTKR
jgi:hypothetical protein